MTFFFFSKWILTPLHLLIHASIFQSVKHSITAYFDCSLSMQVDYLNHMLLFQNQETWQALKNMKETTERTRKQ